MYRLSTLGRSVELSSTERTLEQLTSHQWRRMTSHRKPAATEEHRRTKLDTVLPSLLLSLNYPLRNMPHNHLWFHPLPTPWQLVAHPSLLVSGLRSVSHAWRGFVLCLVLRSGGRGHIQPSCTLGVSGVIHLSILIVCSYLYYSYVNSKMVIIFLTVLSLRNAFSRTVLLKCGRKVSSFRNVFNPTNRFQQMPSPTSPTTYSINILNKNTGLYIGRLVHP